MASRPAKRLKRSSKELVALPEGYTAARQTQPPSDPNPKDYTVGWICAIPLELMAARAMLDKTHTRLGVQPKNDNNSYTLGSIGDHHVVIACLPEYGTNRAAIAAQSMQSTFPNLRFGLMVGIGGAAPSAKNDIRLGDLVISLPSEQGGGVIQYDLGRIEVDEFCRAGSLNKPPTLLRNAVTDLRATRGLARLISNLVNEAFVAEDDDDEDDEEWTYPSSAQDILFCPTYTHIDLESDCELCSKSAGEGVLVERSSRKTTDPKIHYGNIASGNSVVKNAMERDRLAKRDNVICFEMEAAGLMDDFPCLVTRGICDYADSHKNSKWQPYASAVAAAYAKQLLLTVTSQAVENLEPIRDIIQGIAEDVSLISGEMHNLNQRRMKTERLTILDWLTPIDYFGQQYDSLSRRHPGTGEWLISSNEFLRWIDTSGSTLFCPGMSGAGKTIMASIVIDYLLTKFRDLSDIGITFIYCNYREQDKQRSVDLLSSLLRQLICWQPFVPESVKVLYEKYGKRRSRPLISEIAEAICSIAGEFHRTFIIVDALDKCHSSNNKREQFLSVLFDIQTRQKANVFATSRFTERIEGNFEKAVKLEIRAHEEDVRSYLHERIPKLRLFRSKPFHSLQEEVESVIAQSAGGMFLLAQLHIDSLEDKVNAREVRRALETLRRDPSSTSINGTSSMLDQAYTQSMERINGQLPGLQNLALRVLLWITCASRPLTKSELQHALGVELGRTQLDEDNLTEIDIMISSCHGLVTVDKQSNIIRLIHYTTQDYFERTQQKWFSNAHDEITRTCITYLSFGAFGLGICDSDKDLEIHLNSYALYEYSATNWGYHARGASPETQNGTILDFLGSGAKLRAAFDAMSKAHPNQWLALVHDRRDIEEMMELHFAACFGLAHTTAALLDRNQEPDVKDNRGRTPLSWAAAEGHEVIINILAKRGASIDAVDTEGETPLLIASWRGHEAVAAQLLQQGANFDSGNHKGETSLLLASYNGYEKIVRLLLERRTNVNRKDVYGLTPLLAAVSQGHHVVAELLLENNAKVNVMDEDGLTPLLHAIDKNDEALALTLLEKGANPNLISSHARAAPLPLAVEKSFWDLVKQMLEQGAEADIRARDGENSLFKIGLTLAREDAGIIELLLKNGADVDARDYRQWTPLHHAAHNGHDLIVSLLLANGAEINMQDSEEWTPLCRAVERGRVNIVRLLLANGAGINIQASEGWTPLHFAARWGRDTTVRLLLANGAGINIQESGGWTPLHWAARGGHDTTAKVLLDHGVDINLKSTAQSTPLQIAIWYKNVAVANLLREHGAEEDVLDTPSDDSSEFSSSREQHSSLDDEAEPASQEDSNAYEGEDDDNDDEMLSE